MDRPSMGNINRDVCKKNSCKKQILNAVNGGAVSHLRHLIQQYDFPFDGSLGQFGNMLSYAIEVNQCRVVEFLIKAGCNVNYVDYYGEPPVCAAARLNNLTILGKLLDCESCDVDKTDYKTENTALCVAIKQKNIEAMQMILDAGGSALKVGEMRSAPLQLAIATRDLEVVQTLLNQTCHHNWTHINAWGEMALHSATDPSCPISILGACLSAFYRDICTSCLGRTSLTDILDRKGNTLLHAAIWNPPALKVLLERDLGFIYIRNQHNQTPLSTACIEGVPQALPILIEAGADINVQSYGKTPLHIAASGNDTESARILMKYECNVNIKDSQGWTPLRTALEANNEQIILMLLADGPKYGLDARTLDNNSETLLFADNKCTKVDEITSAILGLGCDINQRNFSQKTALLRSMEKSNYPYFYTLLRHHADVNAACEDSTLLHYCVKERECAMMKTLIRHGADVWARSPKTRERVADCANMEGYDDIVDMLLACGAPISSKYIHMGLNTRPTSPHVRLSILEASTIPSLQSQCRSSLWRYVTTNKLNCNTYRNLTNYPAGLVDFINYKRCFPKGI